jgi:hypothetical protein
MMHWKRILTGVLTIFIATTICYAWYLWNKPHRDVHKEKGIAITAMALFDSFYHNEKIANNSFLNKTIEVTGKVTNVKTNSAGETVVYLQSSDPIFGINCTFKKAVDSIKKDQLIVFKGICTGYLDDVILNNGELVSKLQN